MSKKFDIVTSEKYQDRDGNEKTRYTNIGAVFETAKGMSMKLESLPIGWNGWASFYEPKPREERPQQQSAPRGGQQQRRAQDDDMGEVPF